MAKRKRKSQRKWPHLVGSKWTARQPRWGWRHFHAINRQTLGKRVFVELVATCDAQTRFWIEARQLQDRQLWQPGWRPLSELSEEALDED